MAAPQGQRYPTAQPSQQSSTSPHWSSVADKAAANVPPTSGVTLATLSTSLLRPGPHASEGCTRSGWKVCALLSLGADADP